MSGPGRFILATLMGAVLGAVVHLAAVLGMPWLAERDAFSRLRATLSVDRAELIEPPGAPGDRGAWLPLPDPAMALGACAYNLDEGPIRISARTGALFESLSIHARGGRAFYAITDRAAVRGALDLVIMTRRQLDDALAQEEEDEARQDVRVVSPSLEGVVIVRVLAGLPSQRAEAAEMVRAVTCALDAAPETR